MKNITTPYEGYYQVRIARNNQVYRKNFFSKSKAILWRDEMLGKLGAVDRFDCKLNSRKENKTTGINGIFSSIKTIGNNRYLIFSCHYRNEKKIAKTKTFSAGNIDRLTKSKESKIFKVALLFRLRYENSRKKGREVNINPRQYSSYKNWSNDSIDRFFEQSNIPKEKVRELVAIYFAKKI